LNIYLYSIRILKYNNNQNLIHRFDFFNNLYNFNL
jgi:hypothetical protein